MDVDWYGGIGGTRELLACVPGLSEPAFKMWRVRQVVQLSASGTGTGHPAAYLAADALQVAVAHELAQQTAMVAWTRAIWISVQGVMHFRQYRPGDATRDAVLAVRALPNGLLRTWRFRDGEPLPVDLPTSALVLRVDRLIDAVAARVAALQPTRA